MTKKNDITLPTPEDERLLNDVLEDSVDYVEVRGKKYGISWLKRGTIRKFTSTMQKSGNDDKISCQCAAAIILNGYWKIKFFYPFLWRWFFYIKQYGDHELMKVIAVGKKKIPVEDYLTATIYLTAMKDTMMTIVGNRQVLSVADRAFESIWDSNKQALVWYLLGTYKCTN